MRLYERLLAMNEFKTQILMTIHQIPLGKISTYGDIASFSGFPGYARQVGQLLKKLPNGSTLPWHRVINSKGEIALSGDDYISQREKLEQEGIVFNQSGKVNLKRYRWQR